jgi:hypothetical protein
MSELDHPRYTPVNPSDEIQVGILREMQAIHADIEAIKAAFDTAVKQFRATEPEAKKTTATKK